MATTSNRALVITFTGDVTATQALNAAANAVSPGQEQILTLASGANTITAPVVVGVVNTALTIIPPAGNVQTITLKGITGDTGVALHLTDHTTIALATTFTTCVLTAGGIITGLRLIWS
jgi:hypothetical protein